MAITRIFAATSRYIQGPDTIELLGRSTGELGKSAVVVTDAEMARRLGPRIGGSFRAAALPVAILQFPGEVTLEVIESLAAKARRRGADVVVGVGGGKALDTAKGVARKLGARYVSVPTVASNDGPASASIAIYDNTHRMVEIQHLLRNPDLVVVDTAVIAAAPPRFLRAGIGDAISKKFEAEACVAAGASTLLGAPASLAGLVAADACYRIIRGHAAAALQAAEAGQPSADLEALVEATVLLSTLSFENGGLSVAHALARGFPHLTRAAGSLHGEHVAYGLLVQLVLEDRPEPFMEDMLAFYQEIDLPTRMADFGLIYATEAEVRELAEKSTLSPSLARFPRQLTADDLVAAIRRVERLAAHA